MGVGLRLRHGADAFVEVSGRRRRAERARRRVVVRRSAVRAGRAASQLRQQLVLVLYTPFACPQL